MLSDELSVKIGGLLAFFAAEWYDKLGKGTEAIWNVSEESNRIQAREQRVKRMRSLTLMSDTFMSVALNDIPACQYVLRTLTGIESLNVKEVRTQYRVSKTDSRDAILDVLAEDASGKLYNLEIQRLNTVDHARRTRFYGAMIDSSYLEKGTTYADLPEVYIFYLSETDIWQEGHTIYEVEKHFKNTKIPYDDGLHIVYVNAAIDDGSKIAAMMQYFKASDPEDQTQGELSKRVRYLKSEEGGRSEMCEVSEEIFQEGKEEGREEEKRATAISLFQMGMSVEKIAEAVRASVKLVQEWVSSNGTVSPAK